MLRVTEHPEALQMSRERIHDVFSIPFLTMDRDIQGDERSRQGVQRPNQVEVRRRLLGDTVRIRGKSDRYQR